LHSQQHMASKQPPNVVKVQLQRAYPLNAASLNTCNFFLNRNIVKFLSSHPK
jgi:hypothetical protein